MSGSEPHSITTTQVLGQTWQVFRKHFLCFLAIMAPLPSAFLLSIPIVFLLIASGPGTSLREAYQQASPLSKAGIVLLALVWNGVMIRACSATIIAASEFHLGNSIKALEAFVRVKRKPLRLFWLMFIVGIMSVGPLAIVAIPVSIAWLPAIPIAVLENLGVGKALERSSLLTKGGRGRVILLALVYAVLVIAALFGLIVFLSVTHPWAEAQWVRTMIGLFSFWVVLLVPQCLMIALTLNYFDQRLRNENRTLEPPTILFF